MTGDIYKVLIACRNDKTGHAFVPGDLIVAGQDFKVGVCNVWAKQVPPVLVLSTAKDEEE